MKKLLIATALLASTALANAADIGQRYTPQAAASPGGLYLGISGGYGWSDVTNRASVDDFAATDIPVKSRGFIGGVYAGYDMRVIGFLAGIETDISWANIRGSDNISGKIGGTVPYAAQVDDRLRWLGTTRGRIGYSFGSLTPYVTGGLAYGGVSTDANGVIGASSVNASFAESWSGRDTRFGWAAGGGIEYALTQNLSARVEYLHYDLGTSHYAIAPGVSLTSDHAGDIVRAGVGFRF